MCAPARQSSPFYKFQQAVYRHGVRNMAQDRFLAVIDGHLVVSLSDISPVSVGHLAGAVDYASHHGDYDVMKMRGASFDFLEGIVRPQPGQAMYSGL